MAPKWTQLAATAFVTSDSVAHPGSRALAKRPLDAECPAPTSRIQGQPNSANSIGLKIERSWAYGSLVMEIFCSILHHFQNQNFNHPQPTTVSLLSGGEYTLSDWLFQARWHLWRGPPGGDLQPAGAVDFWSKMSPVEFEGKSMDNWLVVWNHGILLRSIQLGIITPTDFHIFQRGWNHQPDKIKKSLLRWSKMTKMA